MLYTATPLTGKAVQSPSFTKRGIDGLTAGRLNQLHHVGIAVDKQLAYDGYMTNLPAFLYATSVQSRVIATNVWYKPVLSNEHVIPIPLPPLCILSKKPYKNDEEKSAFRNSLGPIEVDESKGLKGQFFILRKPTLNTLKDLPLATIDPHAPSPQDATSLSGLISFVQTLKVISLFLATHTYPYKQTPIDNGDDTTDAVILAWKEGRYHSASSLDRVPRTVGVIPVDLGDEDFQGSTPALAGGSITSGRGAVLVAKPAPLRPSINYGVPSTIPNLPGYVLPYFRGLIEPSKDTIIAIYRRFFLGTIAKDRESSNEAWYEWLRGVDKWYQTESGRIVTHILFNIQTALEAQARIFLIIRGSEYLGCAILGFGSAILINGKFVAPDPASRVKADALELDGHSLAVEEIRSLLVDAYGDGMVDELLLDSTRQVFKEINAAPKIDDDEDLEKLREAVSRLAFDDVFNGPSMENIVKALRSLTIAEDEDIQTWPMYLDPSMIYNTSRAHQVLSSFGPTAPSFVDSAGKDFSIPKGLLDEDPLSTFDPSTGKRAMDVILVSMKRIPQAVGDWTNVVKKRRIRQNVAERAAGFRTIQFRGNGRDSIWTALKQIPFEETGGKRKRASSVDEDDADGAAKKKVALKKVGGSDLDLSDLF